MLAQAALLPADGGIHQGERIVGAELEAQVETVDAMRMYGLLHLTAHR